MDLYSTAKITLRCANYFKLSCLNQSMNSNECLEIYCCMSVGSGIEKKNPKSKKLIRKVCSTNELDAAQWAQSPLRRRLKSDSGRIRVHAECRSYANSSSSPECEQCKHIGAMRQIEVQITRFQQGWICIARRTINIIGHFGLYQIHQSAQTDR